MTLFENGGARADYLGKVCSFLMTVKPTSRVLTSRLVGFTVIRNEQTLLLNITF